jgi:hypothetical protein
LLATVREHLIRNRRHPDFGVWKGPGNRDSSDDEWDEHFWAPTAETTREVDVQVDTRRMVEETFQQANETYTLEERVQEVALDAFALADAVHANCMEDGVDESERAPDAGTEEPVGESADGATDDDCTFDPQMLEEAIKPLYRGARCTELAGTILIMNLCTVHGVSNNFTEELFALLHSHLLPVDNSLPKNYHTAKSLTGKLGLSYRSIHACEKGCILFCHEHSEVVRCPKCGGPRYRDEARKLFPVKVLRHFLVIPRLQRMFRSPCLLKLMLWHSENRSNREGGDTLVRHPCDSKAWKHFEENVDPVFKEDARNVHFALAADGVNPFKQTRSTWSTWPVLLLNYNLPPWLCTKKFFIMLALLIPGKQLVTTENFDVYMEPLLEELLELWKGVLTYDVLKDMGSREFRLRGMLLWTIHDYPWYGTVGDFAHQGYVGCPYCGPELGAEHSSELGKQIYAGTRRWLDQNHPYHSEAKNCHFNGKSEHRDRPTVVTVEEQVQ